MERILTICVNFLLLSICCLAQNKLTVGLQARLGTSEFRNNQQIQKAQNRTTFGGGIYVDVPISRNLSVRPQIGWLRKGYQIESTIFSSPGRQLIGVIDNKFSYDYIPLDLTLVYRSRIEKVWKPFVQLGVRGSYLVDNETKRTSSSQVLSGSLDLENFRRLTVGGILAIGIEWNRFSFGLEANRDLSTFLAVPPIALFDDFRPKLGWYGLNLSYQLRNF